MVWSRGKLFITLISILLLIGAVSTSFATGNSSSQGAKNETVYVNLHGDGSVSEINVVNSFSGFAGDIVDFGDYEEIINLTNTQKPEVVDDQITFAAAKQNPFYYQGKMRKQELPWQFRFNYELDGQEIESSSLTGAEGQLKITIDVEQNKKAVQYFQDNYLLQITVPLNMKQVSDVTAPAAAKIVAGQTLTLSFNLLPGETGSFVIEADVQNFEMRAIEIAALKSNFTLDSVGDIEDGFNEMSGGMKEIISGTTQLKTGMGELNEGVNSLHKGIVELSSGQSKLLEGMDNYRFGLSKFNGGLPVLRGYSSEIKNGLDGAVAGSEGFLAGYVSIEAGLSEFLTNKEQLAQLAHSLSESADESTRILALAMIAQLQGIEGLAEGMAKSNEGYALYTEGIGALAQQYGEFDKGIEEVTSSGEGLKAGFDGIYEGTLELQKGFEGLGAGAGRLNNETAKIPTNVQKMIDGQKEMDNGITEARNRIEELTTPAESDETVSFVAPGKAFPDSVQFIIRTPYLEENSETPVSADEEKESKNIWQRFTSLFENWF